MNRLFVEAKSSQTAEGSFLNAILKRFFPDKQVQFVYMDGVAHLFNETNLNIMHQSSADGENVLVLIDADTIEKGWGYDIRKKDVERNMKMNDIHFPLFLYPDNTSDGDVEMIMESIARKEKHPEWWDCFSDYEKCVSGVKDANGNQRYNLPNLKAKLHTFISSQQLSNSQRRKLGSGNWLFDNMEYWNLDHMEAHPLVEFLRNNLK